MAQTMQPLQDLLASASTDHREANAHLIPMNGIRDARQMFVFPARANGYLQQEVCTLTRTEYYEED